MCNSRFINRRYSNARKESNRLNNKKQRKQIAMRVLSSSFLICRWLLQSWRASVVWQVIKAATSATKGVFFLFLSMLCFLCCFSHRGKPGSRKRRALPGDPSEEVVEGDRHFSGRRTAFPQRRSRALEKEELHLPWWAGAPQLKPDYLFICNLQNINYTFAVNKN